MAQSFFIQVLHVLNCSPSQTSSMLPTPAPGRNLVHSSSDLRIESPNQEKCSSCCVSWVTVIQWEKKVGAGSRDSANDSSIDLFVSWILWAFSTHMNFESLPSWRRKINYWTQYFSNLLEHTLYFLRNIHINSLPGRQKHPEYHIEKAIVEHPVGRCLWQATQQGLRFIRSTTTLPR